MSKIRIGVLFGGRSGEHEVSLRSAASILEALDRSKYDVVPVAVTKQGRWLAGRDRASLPPAAVIRQTLEGGNPVMLAPGSVASAFVDVIFPVLHGTYGEDGTVQGFLEVADIPYVGAGVLGSAIAMDKDVTKRLLREAGIPVVDGWVVRKSTIEEFLRRRSGELSYPVFVKPAGLGSSVGVSKVHGPAELPAALSLAAEFDAKIIVEEGLAAREIEVSVLGSDEPIVSVPGEVIPSGEFYDYQAKYQDESGLEIPARLDSSLTRRVQAPGSRGLPGPGV